MNVIGNAHGVSKMSVSRCINIVSKCMANNIKDKLCMISMTQDVRFSFSQGPEWLNELGSWIT